MSGIALMQLKMATMVSMMSKKGTSGVSAGWIIFIRLTSSISTPPGSVIAKGSGISGISRQSGMAIRSAPPRVESPGRRS